MQGRVILHACAAALVACAIASASPVLEIISPKAGDVAYVGDTLHIAWTADSTMVQRGFVVELSLDNKKASFEIIGSEALPNSARMFRWHIPEKAPTEEQQSILSEQCVVSVHEYDGEGISSGRFAIRQEPPKDTDSSDKGGCGTGAGLALIPALFCMARPRSRRNRRRHISPRVIAAIASTFAAAMALLTACGEIQGPDSDPSFDLAPNATYTRLEVGDTLSVAFTVRNADAQYSYLLHLLDTTESRIPITNSPLQMTSGSCKWRVPDSVSISGVPAAFPGFQRFALSISEVEGRVPADTTERIYYIGGKPHAEEGIVLLRSPNGGERYKVGDSLRVAFGSVSGDELTCIIELLWDKYAHSLTNEESISTLEGVFTIQIPDSIYDNSNLKVPFPTGDGFRIEVREYGMGSAKDQSDAVFSISK